VSITAYIGSYFHAVNPILIRSGCYEFKNTAILGFCHNLTQAAGEEDKKIELPAFFRVIFFLILNVKRFDKKRN
jgi:hypothetical protein